ncbi:uncharacterized protein LOC125233925 isoform X2 [Leguminivora glycinivorella]|uniref:uncharacterized protein LOC125233925 isoform X2 n=1 Tax=Leguminivora glycinivorella TaxID=1035111 RepID=UPI00200F749D|nr:uncharacterized protein LOC125233925 isoform X2 [Leguminivora glycinivorella]
MAFIRTMRVSIWLLCLYWTLGDASSEENLRELDYRAKRQINALPLVYPYGATYKYQYVQFTNITQLSRYYVINTVSREQRNADAAGRREERVLFYRSVAEVMDSKGLNGRECVLRAICEAAQFPVEEEGFVGELLHVLLTPDYGKSPFEEIDEELKETMAPYVDAAVAGRQMFSCAYIYSGCPEGQGILEFISQLRDE